MKHISQRHTQYINKFYKRTGSLWLDYDPIYLSLGNTQVERQKGYQRWIHESIPENEWNLIRNAVQKNWVYGSDRFKEEIEKNLGRRFEIKKAGRKAKT